MAGRNSRDPHDERADVLDDLRDALDLEFVDGELLPGPHRHARPLAPHDGAAGDGSG